MVEQAFKVLTEFRFDISSAVANSQTLQSEVGKISAAADSAHFALQRVGVGLVAQMGLGSGGFLGAIYNALKASDKFANSQRQIANIFLTNDLFTGADSFENSMVASAQALERMRQAASKFSLPATDMVNFTKLVGASLISHGLDNSNMNNSIDLARGFLKSAPTLGIDPGLAQGQLLDAVMGRANMGDTLFQRLMNETTAMKPFAGTAGAKAFNALDPAKRLDVLTKSLMQFGSNAKIVDENARSLSSQLQRLQDNFTSMFSVLKPIGDAIMEPIKMILMRINTFLENDGRKISENFAKIIKDIFANPEKLFVNIQQARRLQSDVKTAGSILSFIAIMEALTWVLRTLGFTLRGGLIMTGLRSLIAGLSAAFAWFVRVGGVSLIFRTLGFLLRAVLAPLALFTFFLQVISRGMAKAQVANAKWLVDNMVRISEMIHKFKVAMDAIILPIVLAMETLSDWVAWIFRLDISGNILIAIFQWIADGMIFLGRVMVGWLSVIAGITNTIIGFMFDLVNLNFADMFSNIPKNFMEGFNDFFNKYDPQQKLMTQEERIVSGNNIKIDKIEIQNSFKEQMEPDRIAFTLKEQLIKAALNPQQATGRSLRANAIAQ